MPGTTGDVRRALGEPELLEHLVATRLAGRVATSCSNAVGNAGKLLAGDPDYTFGLPDWQDTTFDEVVVAVAKAGGSWEPDEATGDGAFIDPAAAVAAIARHRETLRGFVVGGGGRVLVTTGHPYGLLAHYAAVARALVETGSVLLRPLAGRRDVVRRPDGRGAGVGYPDGVAALAYGGGLHHTHRAHYMEAMLDEVGGADGVDLVLGDHGFAGAAIAAGIPTLSIADINDPALPLAQARGRTDGVLMIDDGLEPMLAEPVTQAILAGLRR